VFIGDARSPVGRTRNATSDVQIETSLEHGISSILQFVIRPQRENVGTLLIANVFFKPDYHGGKVTYMLLLFKAVANNYCPHKLETGAAHRFSPTGKVSFPS
jgi:hypothetical protein